MQSANKFNKVYRRRYTGFAGVDFSNPPVNVALNRSPYAENIYTDEVGIIHKRRGWRRIAHYSYSAQDPKEIFGIFSYVPRVRNEASGLFEADKYLMIHHGGSLYMRSHPDSLIPVNTQIIPEGLHYGRSVGFQHANKFYLMDGENYWVVYYDDAINAFTYKKVYQIATPAETQIAGYWYAEEYTDENGDTQFEYTWTFGEEGERNLLTARRINTFCGDGPAEAPAVAHKTFFFDRPNFHVYKVELYSPSEGASAAEGTVVCKPGVSNIRNKPSMDGRVIGYGREGDVFVVLGQVGNWYKIQYRNETNAYINASRVTYNAPSGGSGTPTASSDWVEIPSDHATYGWTVAEATTGDAASNCTKITFTTAPPAHPRGHGLPNIRVTGAVTEVASEIQNAHAQNDLTFTYAPDAMLIEVISVVKRHWTGADTYVDTTLTENTHWAQTTVDGTTTVTVYGIVNNQHALETGDQVTVSYRRESFEDIDTVGTCRIYGRFGEYNFDRYFFTGNKQYPNRDWYSEPSDPTMVLQNSYTDIGNSTNAIAGYLNFQSEMLVIKFDGEGDCLFRRTATTDGDITIFPVKNYSGRGAINEDCLCNINGECFYLSPEGLYEFVSSDMSTMHAIQSRDILVRRRLLNSIYDGCQLVAYKTLLMITCPMSGEIFVADTLKRTARELNGAYSFEWYYWTGMPMHRAMSDYNDMLIYANFKWGASELADLCIWPHGDGYIDYPDDVLNNSKAIWATWQTPFDQMDEPGYYKYIERRGMTVQLAKLWTDSIVQQGFHMAIVVDSHKIADERVTPILWDSGNTAYDLNRLKADYGEQPCFTVDRRINRFSYIQLVFTNDDPSTEGFGIICIELLYHYGRPYIKGGVGG